ncbi:hypothetical protein [Streptomyces sp. 1331.2]|uniref:hypothetical protein n=1 Tax=Streptomyces sp. 1331.2 TaxID=1938835 RepID=UPI000BC76ACD|nr:hypothetical protein [Streptomyces sp. 1331.2]SOB85697.1 hypothetical protein SAMN06272789_5988 [Streptomyces sp. 1331.2]
MPERLAAFTVEFLGPQAADTVVRAREAERTGTPRGESVEAVIGRGVRRSVVEGSFLGGPFVLLLPVAFIGALLAQLRMVLELGALAGRDPCDQEAAVEILLVQGVHPTRAEARAALREASRGPVDEGGKGSWFDVVRRQAYLIGLLAPDDPARSRIRKWLGWAGIGALLVIGTVVPFVWVPACGEMYRRATDRLADRTLALLGSEGGGPVPVRDRDRDRSVLRPGLLLVVLRTVGACAATVGGVLVVLLTGARVAGNSWLAVFLVLLGAGAVVAGWHWLRSRH